MTTGMLVISGTQYGQTVVGLLDTTSTLLSKIFSEAQPVDLECGLRFNPGSDERWTTCKWTKIFRDIPADWVSHALVMSFRRILSRLMRFIVEV